jgi:predicted metal-dependent peptidase
MDQQVFERIVCCRISLLMKFAFWGSLATRLQLKEDSDWCNTAATDGRNIYYNPKFMGDLTDKQIVFVVCHELLHVLLDHLGRGKTDNKMLSNIAADFAVNAILVKEKIGDHIGQYITKADLINYDAKNPKVGTLYDTRYVEWSYEQIYDDLLQDQDKLEKSLGSGDVSFDQHIDGNGENGEPELSSSEIQSIKDEMREAVLSAAQQVGIGNVPGQIKRLIGDLTEPKMDWRQLLTQYIESQVKSDYTYMRIGRRSFSSDCIFPSMKKEPRVQVTLVCDTSGSITNADLKDFFSEVLGIMESHSSFEIGIICFDTKTYNYKVFTEDNREEIMEYQPMGGGGTDYSCVTNWLEENDIVPKQCVVFTDLEIYNFGNPDYCETLWLVKNTRKGLVAPYGETIYYED